MLPGAKAAQLSIFLGYAHGGWWGGLLGGLCFVLPGFVVLLALTIGYATLGVSPILRGALYGLGPVVLGIYLVAVYRLARVALSTRSQVAIAIAPHALPDVLAGATLIATVVVLMLWRVATLKVMLVGAVLGVVRGRLVSLPGARAVLSAVMRA
jgi:chromate transport protein ChrA